MECANCGDVIGEDDPYYDAVTPIQGGGQTTDEFCSIACLNEDVGFSEEEIESLMRQANYEVPPELDSEWLGIVEPEINDLLMDKTFPQGEFFTLFNHIEKGFDVEIYWDPEERLYEVNLYEYENEDKSDLTRVSQELTSVHQRAVYYARRYMKRVENGRY